MRKSRTPLFVLAFALAPTAMRVNAQSAPRLAAYYARIFPEKVLAPGVDFGFQVGSGRLTATRNGYSFITANYNSKLRVPLTIVGILATRPYLITPRALAPHN